MLVCFKLTKMSFLRHVCTWLSAKKHAIGSCIWVIEFLLWGKPNMMLIVQLRLADANSVCVQTGRRRRMISDLCSELHGLYWSEQRSDIDKCLRWHHNVLWCDQFGDTAVFLMSSYENVSFLQVLLPEPFSFIEESLQEHLQAVISVFVSGLPSTTMYYDVF